MANGYRLATQPWPSQILMEMRRLVGDVTHTGEAILKRIWKSKLPSAVSMVLPLLPADKSFDELAKAADSLWDEYYANFNNATQPTYSTTSFAIPHAQPTYSTMPFAIPQTQPNGPALNAPGNVASIQTNELSTLRAEVNEMKKAIADFTSMMKEMHMPAASECYSCSAKDRSRSPRRPQSPSPFRRSSSPGPMHNVKFFDNMCFYHFRFGKKVQRCRKGCVEYDPKLIIIEDSKNE